jgi:hypothetical protein
VVGGTGFRQQLGEELVDQRLEDDQAVANDCAMNFDDPGKQIRYAN